MYRILLILLATTLVCSNAQQTVNDICKQTIDIRFCKGILAKATSPSTIDLLKVTVTEAERLSADAYSLISTIFSNIGNGLGLQNCVEAYARVNASFTNAVSLFDNERYAEIITLMDVVSNGVGICTTDFNVPGYKINPMIVKNRETYVLAAMEKIIGRKVSS